MTAGSTIGGGTGLARIAETEGLVDGDAATGVALPAGDGEGPLGGWSGAVDAGIAEGCPADADAERLGLGATPQPATTTVAASASTATATRHD